MDQLIIKTRPRTAEEVTSLGFLIGKKYFFPLWLTSLAAMLPWLVISIIVIWTSQSWTWGVFALWLGKPYFERPALLLLSRLIFGEKWHLADIKADLLSGLRGKLWLDLTFTRAGSRIARAAVHLLENLESRDLRLRLQYVKKKSRLSGVIIGLSFIETAFIISLLTLFMTAWPNFHLNQLPEMLAMSWGKVFLYGLIFLAFSVSNVFFVAIGFMDYLNQRIINEGWAIALDLQTLFKRLLIVFCLSLSPLVPHLPARAAEMTVISEAEKNFLREKAHDPKVTPFTEKRIPKTQTKNNPSHMDLGRMSAYWSSFIRLLVILAVIGVFIWLAVIIWRGRQLKKSSSTQKKSPSPLMIETQSSLLITNPAEKARELLQAGQEVAALSLLYRASLQQLTADFAIPIQSGDSEKECLHHARPRVPEAVFLFLEQIIFHWQQAAYAGKPPTREVVAQCIEQFARLWA